MNVGQVGEKSCRRVARLVQHLKSMDGRNTAVDVVEAKLIRGILEGVFPPGGRLPGESRLARELGIGRATLRSALSRLISRGLLQTSPGRQTRVSELGKFATLDTLIARLVGEPNSGQSRHLLTELFEVRRHLYATLLTLACERAKNLDAIQEVCMGITLESRHNAEPMSFLNLELELLAAAAAAANNRAFFYVLGSLHRLFERLPAAFTEARTPERIAERVGQISRMMDARNTKELRRFTLESLEAEDQASAAVLTTSSG